MYAIFLNELVGAIFWRQKFRYAVIIVVIFDAIITPDGSGVTLWFVSVPMIVLSLVGILAIERKEKRRKVESTL